MVGRTLCTITIAFATVGCAGNEPVPEPAKEVVPATNNRVKGDVERVVRAVLADVFKVVPSEIQMDKPITDPPFNCDDIDLLEVILQLEEKLGISITEDVLDRNLQPKFGNKRIAITPEALILIAVDSPPASKRK